MEKPHQQSFIHSNSNELVRIGSQMSHRVAHSSEDVNLQNLEPFWKVQMWVDTQVLVTKSSDVMDAL